MFGPWSVALGAEVSLTLGRYEALTGAAERPPAAPAPFVSRRDVVLEQVGDELRLTATWRVEVPARGPVALPLVGPGLRIEAFTVDGRPGGLLADESGATWTGTVDHASRLVLRGILTDPGAELRLLAAVGDLALPADRALVGGIEVSPGRWVPADPAAIAVGGRPARERDRGDLVMGSVGYGLTFGDGELRRVAHLRWVVRAGSLREVAFTVPGAGPDLRVESPQVAGVRRDGDRVVVELGQPETARVDLVVRSSSPLGAGDVETVTVAPPVLEGVFRSETALVLARDGELDLLPDVAAAAIALPRVPDWATGLVDGVATAAFLGPSAAGRVEAIRYTPASGPATLCDVASFTVALSEEGRALVRAHYTIRNDRGHLLRITPPPGFAPISAQVGQEPVTVSRVGDAWLVPLEKSLETAEGLLTLPVEVAFLGSAEAFRRRDRRDLPLPAIDVETALTRVTVHLPPGFRNTLRPDTAGRVAEFTEGQGVTYGFAVGDTRAAEAETYFQDALASWYDNDFERAQEALDAISELGGSNANVLGLQGNLDVIAGRGEGESATGRRIKDQARARAFGEYEKQRELLDEAERWTNSGDYGKADEAYAEAARLAEELGRLSNEEDVVQAEVLEQTKLKQQDNALVLEKKAKVRASLLAEPPPPPPPPMDLEEEPEQPVFEESATVRVTRSEIRIADDDPDVLLEVLGTTDDPVLKTAIAARLGELAGRPLDLLAPSTLAEVPGNEPAAGPPPVALDEYGLPVGDEPVVAIDGEEAEPVALLPPPPAKPARAHRGPPPKAPELAAPELPAPFVGYGEVPPDVAAASASTSVDVDARAPKRSRAAAKPATAGGKVAGHYEPPAPKVGVTATSASVVVPSTGEAVRYQHLLLTAGEAYVVLLQARRSFTRETIARRRSDRSGP